MFRYIHVNVQSCELQFSQDIALYKSYDDDDDDDDDDDGDDDYYDDYFTFFINSV